MTRCEMTPENNLSTPDVIALKTVDKTHGKLKMRAVKDLLMTPDSLALDIHLLINLYTVHTFLKTHYLP